ncbi:hypothetical protein A2U01_0078562, partial [Trifolium medium]|nr:hypothetical protein [Trifolium medium]
MAVWVPTAIKCSEGYVFPSNTGSLSAFDSRHFCLETPDFCHCIL